MPMKKCKKIVCVIITACVLVGAAFAALVFMGVFNMSKWLRYNTEDENWQTENGISDTVMENELWHIVFKGYAFSVEPVGIAIIHESGCLNIRNCDDYLIQIDVEDKTMADFWDNREQLVENIEDSGYVMELFPEKLDIQGKEYIRYIVSIANERGAEFDKSYFCQLICDAGDGQRIFASIRFDGIDIDGISGSERERIYKKAVDETATIVAGAVPTDETNDMTGSYWQEEETTETAEIDCVENGDTSLSYEVPENYSLLNEDLSGKTYYSDVDKIKVMTSIVPYTWMSAAEMAEKKTGAGISKTIEEGQREINGVTFYYYAYSVLYVKTGDRKLTYYLNAYADLKNGEIYTINSFANDNPDVMDIDLYYKFMNITEK